MCCCIPFMLRGKKSRIARKCKGSVGDNSPIYGRKDIRYPSLKATIAGFRGFKLNSCLTTAVFQVYLSGWWFQRCKIRIKWESFPNRRVFLKDRSAYHSTIHRLPYKLQYHFLAVFFTQLSDASKTAIKTRSKWEGCNGSPLTFTCRVRVNSLVCYIFLLR